MTAMVPTRHPDRPQPVPGLIRVLAFVLGIGKPSADDWGRLGTSLTVGDEPMDRLVEWMYAAGMAQARPLFERALSDGIAAVPDAPQPLREFFAMVEAPPEWVDWDMIRRGQRALRAGGADGMYVARDVSLLGGYMFSGFNKTLLRTGALEKGSNKRFAETMQWAMDVISDEGGLQPQALGYRSTLRVRLIHAFVRRYVAALPDWQPDEWGLPVNQTDMAVTLLGAIIAPTAGSIALGILPRRADLEAIAHLTRYVGWLIGVEEDLLPRSFRDSIRRLYHSLMALSEPDESTRLLAAPMIDDPLTWQYRALPGLRRRLARAQHLSLTSSFLGPRVMRALGLPAFALPWYPLIRLPVNAARSLAANTLPGGKDRAAARGWRQQEQFMRTLGVGKATIGAAAAHVAHAA